MLIVEYMVVIALVIGGILGIICLVYLCSCLIPPKKWFQISIKCPPKYEKTWSRLRHSQRIPKSMELTIKKISLWGRHGHAMWWTTLFLIYIISRSILHSTWIKYISWGFMTRCYDVSFWKNRRWRSTKNFRPFRGISTYESADACWFYNWFCISNTHTRRTGYVFSWDGTPTIDRWSTRHRIEDKLALCTL